MEKVPVTVATLAIDARAAVERELFSLWMVLGGRAAIQNDSGCFAVGANDVFATAPGERVAIQPEESVLVLALGLEECVCQQALGSAGLSASCYMTPGEDSGQLRACILQVAEAYYGAGEGYEMRLWGRLYELMYIMRTRLELPSDGQTQPGEDELGRKQAVEHYITAHYREEITLQSIAQRFHLTPQYFSKYFKLAFGQNFLAYLRGVRLDHATREMLSSDEAVTKIAYGNGFPNLSAFHKAFRARYGVPPNQFVEEHGGEGRLPLPENGAARFEIGREDAARLLRDRLADSGAAGPRGQEVLFVSQRADVRSSRQIRATWNDIVNVEAAAFCLNSALQAQLRQAQEELRFRYARLLWLDSEEVFKGGIHQEQLNFARFGRIIDFLRSVGLRPMFELGPKSPREIVSSHRQILHYSEPASVEQLTAFYRKVLVYSVNRWGMEEVNSWRFEMWIPQTEDGCMAAHTPDSFPRYFVETYRTIKSVVPQAEVGGFGLSINLTSTETAQKVMTRIGAQGLEPDFLSVYFYPAYVVEQSLSTGRVDIGAVLYSDERRLAEKLDQLLELVRGCFPDLRKVYMTEYASDISARLAVNETSYSAAFLVQTVLENFDKLDGMGYWYLSDLIHEADDAATPLFGGNGLLSRDGLKKPGYFALRLLDKMGGRLIDRGKYHMVTSSQDNMYEVLVHNYKSLRSADHGAEGGGAFSQAFDDVRRMHFQLKLTGARPGRYIVKRYALNDSNSLMAGLKALNCKGELGQEDMEYLAGTCVPRQQFDALICEQEIAVTANLEPNEVDLFVVTPVAEL